MYSITNVILLLMLFLAVRISVFSQETYNNCFQALELCPNTSFTVNNLDANKSFCPDCEDDFTFCFTSNNSIWFKFTTNTVGGTAQISFSNLVFEMNPGQSKLLQATLYSTIQPCFGNSYVQIGNCVSNAASNFTLSALALNPNTTYYMVVNGDKSGVGITEAAECTFDILLSGPGVDRPASNISLITSNSNICKNEVVSFSAQLSNCPDSSDYSWFVNGVLVATTQDSLYMTSSLNTGDVVTVTNSCYTLCPQPVTASSPSFNVYSFSVDAGPDIHILPGQTTELNGTTTAPIYNWSPDFLLTSSTILNPVAIPTETTIYTLTATQNGCSDFDDMTVYVDDVLTIPTTFSPNNDGINDVWEILGIDNYPNCYVRIFDRWGQEVFQKTGYNLAKAWNGDTFHGKEIAPSVYFYVLELRDEKKQIIKGSITVIR